MKTSFVIPSYNSVTLVDKVLSDLNSHSEFDEILILDDASPNQKVRDCLDKWNFILPELRVVYNKENIHFLKSSNVGLKLAIGDIKILLSTDVCIETDLGSMVRNVLVDRPHSLIGGKLLSGNTGWNTFDGAIFPYLEGWLLAATADVWRELDYFDERYAPCDFEDVDLSTKALALGMSLIPLNHPSIWHTGAQTIRYNPEREKQTKINQAKFAEKWAKK